MPSAEDFRNTYGAWSDERLRKIVLHPQDYVPEALQAAEDCLRQRGLSTEGPEPDWTDIQLPIDGPSTPNGPLLGYKVLFFLLPGLGFCYNFYWFVASIQGKRDERIAATLPATLIGAAGYIVLRIFWEIWMRFENL